MKLFLRKLTALIAACTMVFAISFPAMAGGESPFMDLTPGDYLTDWLDIYVPNPGGEFGVESTSRLSGPSVNENGILFLEAGSPVTFSYEQTMPYGYRPSYGFRSQLQIGYYELSGHSHYVIPIDGKTTFALPTEGADVSVKIDFDQVSMSSWMQLEEDGYAYGPTLQLDGKITLEVTTMVDGYFTIPKSNNTLAYETVQEHEAELMQTLEKYEAATREGSDGVLFDTPQELTYRIDLDGDMIGFGTENYETALNIGFCVIGDHRYTVSFQNQTYETIVRDENNGGVDFNVYSMSCFLTVEAIDWSISPFMGMGEDPDAPAENSGSSVSLAKAATVTVGAGAAALGGSALASVIGDAVGSTATNLFTPSLNVLDPAMADPAGTVPTGDPILSKPELPETDIPGGKKKRLFDEDEGRLHDDPATTGDDYQNTDSASNTETADNIVSDNTEPTDIPDLPEEDSPEVSMSLYAPGSDLLNIKGGAADMTITIEGGEGYTWNYLPAIIAPGAAKAIIPLVTGRTNLATLALNLTGAATEERHHTVFVNVIAWTTTPAGKLLKASASKEMKLHTPGIEAKRDKDGNITVTAYSDTTLKGYAEIRKLSAEEYILEVMEDESVTIHANDVKLGVTSLKK